MNDRSNFDGSNLVDAASAAASVAADQENATVFIHPTLNEGGGVWMDQVWNEKKDIPCKVLQVLKEVEACVYGAKTVTGLLFADEVHSEDARINPEQVRYSSLDAVTREGLRVASAALFDRAARSLESLRCER